MDPAARCWARVDLDVIADNYRRAKKRLLPGRGLIPVLKADAYGLGAASVGRVLRDLGADLFAVATVPEALRLKQAADADVLVMGMAGADARDAMRAGVTLTAFSPGEALSLSQTARGLGATCAVHFKINTGLNRLGFDSDRIGEILRAAELPGLSVRGIFTHLALHGRESDLAQLDRFDRVLRAFRPPMAHVLDSIGLARYPDRQYDGVRLGAWLYGVHPRDVDAAEDPLAVSLFARVAQVFWVNRGERIGYEDCRAVERDTKVATLACGYADGYPRLNWKGWVMIRGRRAPVLGLVCMDQMMADVTDIPDAAPGDAARLLGGPIAIDEYAGWADMNRNEALVRLSPRVPRVYRGAGKERAVDEGEPDQGIGFAGGTLDDPDAPSAPSDARAGL